MILLRKAILSQVNTGYVFVSYVAYLVVNIVRDIIDDFSSLIRFWFRGTTIEISTSPKSALQSSWGLSVSFIAYVYTVLPVVGEQ